MSGWNWRLFKETVTSNEGKGNPVERISFKETWYNNDGKPVAIGEIVLSLDQFGEPLYGEHVKPDFSNLTFEPINEEEAKENIRFTLTKLLEALDKPIMTEADLTKPA